jgi:tetratricopeptide (TPR) repeat protein
VPGYSLVPTDGNHNVRSQIVSISLRSAANIALGALTVIGLQCVPPFAFSKDAPIEYTIREHRQGGPETTSTRTPGGGESSAETTSAGATNAGAPNVGASGLDTSNAEAGASSIEASSAGAGTSGAETASAGTSRANEAPVLQGSARTTPQHEYHKRLGDLKGAWTSEAADSAVLWRVYQTAAEDAAKKNDSKRALVLAESALEHSRHWKTTDPRHAQTLTFIASECKKAGVAIDSEQLHKLVEPPPVQVDYEVDRSIPTVETEGALESLIHEADVWVLDGQVEKAVKKYRKILAHLKARRSSDGADIVKVVDRLTRLYYKEKRYNEAERLVRTELKDRGSMFELMHEHDPERLQLGFLLADLGLVYSGTDRFIESETLYKAALEIMNQVLGSEHPDSVVTLGELARVHKYMEDYASSEREYRQAISLAKGNPQISRGSRGTIVGNYAKLLRKMGKNEKAAVMEAQAAELSGKALAPRAN